MNYYAKVWAQGDYDDEKGTITSIKQGTFHYSANNGTAGKFRWGNVCSSYCEFDYYTNGAITVNVGDMFDWRYDTPLDQTFNELGGGGVTATDPNADGNLTVSGMTITDDGNGNLTVSNSIGVTDDGNANLTVPSGGASFRTISSRVPFFVVSVKTKKNVCHVVGYDAVYMLEKDYSPRLAQIKNSFPMTISALVTDVCDYCGLKFGFFVSDFGNVDVGYFYSDGITGRDILSYVASLVSSDIEADILVVGMTRYPNSISFTNSIGSSIFSPAGWNAPGTYVICPDNGTYYQEDGVTVATNVWYKENGLDIGYQETAYDGFEFVLSNGQSVGHYYDTQNPGNIYYVGNNPILDNIDTATMTDTFDSYAQLAFDGTIINPGINDIFPYYPINVDIFPFRCPYDANRMTRLVDTDGTYYNLPIMSMDVTEERVHIESFGTDVGYDFVGGNNNANDDAAVLLSKINRLEDAVKTKTVTLTTNSNGNTSSLGISKGTVLSIKRTDASSMVVPYWDTSGNAWNAHVMNSSASPIANTSVTLEVAYYSLK